MPSIIVAGQVPIWAPVLPILVGRDVLKHGTAAEFSPVCVRPDLLETDRALAAKDWARAFIPFAGREALPARGLPVVGRREPAARPAGRRHLIAARAAKALDFRHDINGLRALAVLGVVIFHADRAWLPGGFVGVDIFFVISGFLISRIILAECATGRFSLAMFYARRAKRILPALLVVLSFVWIVGWFMAAPTQFREIGGGLLGNSYFTVNFWLMRLAGVGGYFGAESTVKPLLHLWSLSIEEQFYLIWSVLLLALFKLERRLVLIVILVAFGASFAASVVLTPIDPIAAFYLPWTRGWELALGALLAYREVFWLEATPLSVAIPGKLWARGWNRADARRLPVPERDAAVSRLASGDSRPLAQPWSSPIPHSLPGEVALGNRVAGFFGAISYPLYLWHWPLFAFARIWPGVIPTTPVLLALACVAVRARRAHLPADRAAGRGSVSPPALRDGVGPRGLARADRIHWQADLRRQGLSLPLSAARGPHFRLSTPMAPKAGRYRLLLSARRGVAIRSTRNAGVPRASLRLIIARRSKTRGSRPFSLSATRTPPISSPDCRRSMAPKPIS